MLYFTHVDIFHLCSTTAASLQMKSDIFYKYTNNSFFLLLQQALRKMKTKFLSTSAVEKQYKATNNFFERMDSSQVSSSAMTSWSLPQSPYFKCFFIGHVTQCDAV